VISVTAAQGWYRDPYLVHEDRYFSVGHPTKLVRDGVIEAYDPPPDRPPQVELVEVRPAQRADGSDLLRADDRAAGSAAYDQQAAFWAALDSVAGYGPVA
jgi:hypothetical protein